MNFYLIYFQQNNIKNAKELSLLFRSHYSLVSIKDEHHQKYIEGEKGRAIKIIETLGKDFTFESFEVFFYNKKTPNEKNKNILIESFDNRIKKLKNEGRIATSNLYNTTKLSLLSYSSELYLKDITPSFLNKYENWMLANKKSSTTIGMYMRNLRAILNTVDIKKVLTPEAYPFGKFVENKSMVR